MIFDSILDLRSMGQLQSPAMRFDWPAKKRMVQFHFAILLLLWWGGLNCLSGCLIASARAIDKSHCAMSGDGADCCQAHSGGEEAPSSKSLGAPSTSMQTLACCSLLSLSGNVSREARVAGGESASANLSQIEFTPETGPRVQLPDRWARLPDRGRTHLLHCVYLI